MTPPQPQWVTKPQTEAEWDMHVLNAGPRFFHCWWLATYHPAPRKNRKDRKLP